MWPIPRPRWLEIENLGSVTVAKLTTPQILDEQKVQCIGEQLLGLVDQIGCGSLLMDFTQVRRMSSEMLGKLILLQTRLKANGGKLALYQVNDQLAEIFQAVRLTDLVPIYEEEQEALQSL